jgi:hypothetical protein
MLAQAPDRLCGGKVFTLCIRSQNRAPPMIDIDVSLVQAKTKAKIAALLPERANKSQVNDIKSDTVLYKDPITDMDNVNDNNEDVKDAKLRINTIGMDKVKS